MFKKWKGSSLARSAKDTATTTCHLQSDEDGQLSEIDTSTSDEDEDEEAVRVTASESGVTSDSGAVKLDPQNNIADLLRREFGPRGTLFSVSSQDYLNERRQKRLVSKKGHVQIAQSKVENRRRRYLTDFFNTMLDLKWRYVLLIFTASFFLSWLAFAVIWWVIIYYRGDFDPGHLPDEQEDSGWQPCVYAIHNFASVFLFSVETQHTIG